MKKLLIYITLCFILVQPVLAKDNVTAHAQQAVELGWKYFNQGDAKTALKRFNQAIILKDDFAPAYFGTAYVLSTQNKLNQAIGYYQKTIALEPSFPHSYSNLGLALIYLGKKEEAYKHLKKAIKLAPEDGDINVNMAVWYLEDGQYTKAWKHVRAARNFGSIVKESFIKDLSSKMKEPQ